MNPQTTNPAFTLDPQGYLRQPGKWSTAFAHGTARRRGIVLTHTP